LNLPLLLRRAVLAAALVASVIVFGALATDAFAVWARRSILLSDELWPRRTRLTVDGFDESRHRKLARGGDFELVVKADAGHERDVPEVVEVRYLQGGARGRENMSRSGGITSAENASTAGESVNTSPDRFQLYNYAFKDVLAPLEFYVRGGD